MGFQGIVAGTLFGRTEFATHAGRAADGALFPWAGPVDHEFAAKFTARFGSDADYAAAGAYDAVRLVVAAIRTSGLNRARIADSLRQLRGYEGASGRIEWDATGQNSRKPLLATIQSGRAVRVSVR
jgi:branched-chain amino acid transport system substrate-binding protein